MEIINFILHFDEYLKIIIEMFGPLTYIILFLIVFAETGFVVTPFLPGDSLLFVAGTLANTPGTETGTTLLNIWFVYIVLLTAAFLGDTVNYWIGHYIGPRVFAKENSRIFKKEYLEKTRKFYEKHGGKTIILARFVPIIRTFAPFVAGVGKMHYGTFIFYNIIGGLLWVTGLTFAGYFFGGLPIIKNNFELAVIGIVLISLLPMIYEYANHKLGARDENNTPDKPTYKNIRKTLNKDHLSD